MGNNEVHYEKRAESNKNTKKTTRKVLKKHSAGHILALVKMNMAQAIEKRRALKEDSKRLYEELEAYWEHREELVKRGIPMGTLAKLDDNNDNNE